MMRFELFSIIVSLAFILVVCAVAIWADRRDRRAAQDRDERDRDRSKLPYNYAPRKRRGDKK